MAALMNKNELAGVLGMHPKTIESLEKEGMPVFITKSGARLYNVNKVIYWLSQGGNLLVKPERGQAMEKKEQLIKQLLYRLRIAEDKMYKLCDECRKAIETDLSRAGDIAWELSGIIIMENKAEG